MRIIQIQNYQIKLKNKNPQMNKKREEFHERKIFLRNHLGCQKKWI